MIEVINPGRRGPLPAVGLKFSLLSPSQPPLNSVNGSPRPLSRGLIKVCHPSPVYKERSLLPPDVDDSFLLMVLIFVEDLWETSLVFDIALSEAVGSLKAQIQTITGKSIGTEDQGLD